MEYFSNEFFLIALTFGTYFLGKLLRRWTGWVVMNPILVSICCLIVFLKVTGVSYDTYNQSGKMIEFWLRPAVVALGVPLYMQLSTIKKQFTPILLCEFIGCVVGIVSVVYIAKAMGASREVDTLACVKIGYDAYCDGGDKEYRRYSSAYGCCSGLCRFDVCCVRLSHYGLCACKVARSARSFDGYGSSCRGNGYGYGEESGTRSIRQSWTDA